MTTQVAPLASQQVRNGKYAILVRAGDPGMDKILYKIAVMEFGQLLNIDKNGTQIDQRGRLEITFANTSEGGLLDSASTISAADSRAVGWYNGNGYWGGTAYPSGTSTALEPGTMLNLQNSTMLITLKDTNGIQLWTASYNYNGEWEMSGFWVNTPDKAARLCVKRLKARMERDLFKSSNK